MDNKISKEIDPFLSIVTIGRDNPKELKITYTSIQKRLKEYRDLEWVLILSGDFQKLPNKIIRNNKNVKLKFLKAKGIYDAMNEGIKIAKGKYILFINSGDELYSKNIHKIFDLVINENRDLFFFGVLIENNYKKLTKKICRLNNTKALINGIKKLKMFPHHQGLIYRNTILKKNFFNPQYKIRGDYENLLRILLTNKKLSIGNEELLICKFYADGISNTKFIHYESLKALYENNFINPISIIYFFLHFFKYQFIRFWVLFFKNQ